MKNRLKIYSSNLKSCKFSKEVARIFVSGASDITHRQSANEDQKLTARPTLPKTNFSTCLSILMFAVLLILQIIPLNSAEVKGNKKKYTLSICAIFKDEAKYLKEWIEYHRLVGVDHFYLYNNGSKDIYNTVLNPYIHADIVTLVQWPDYCYRSLLEEEGFQWSLSTQIPAYENAAKFMAIHETKWLVCLNVDEFLVPSEKDKLSEILEQYDEYPAVILSTEFFDSSKDVLPRRKLLIEAIELTQAPRQNIQKQVTKTIFKPDLCEGFVWPPYQFVFKNQMTPIKLKKKQLHINQYVNRFKGQLNFRKPKDKLNIDNRTLSEEEISALLNEGYEIEDQEKSIYRFIPSLMRRLGI